MVLVEDHVRARWQGVLLELEIERVPRLAGGGGRRPGRETRRDGKDRDDSEDRSRANRADMLLLRNQDPTARAETTATIPAHRPRLATFHATVRLHWRHERPRRPHRNWRFGHWFALLAYSAMTLLMTYPVAAGVSGHGWPGGAAIPTSSSEPWWVREGRAGPRPVRVPYRLSLLSTGVEPGLHTLSVLNGFISVPLQPILGSWAPITSSS